MERYHALSDATMDTLLESLESLLDDLGDAGYELEYHVCTVDLPVLILN
jgi:frataxin